MSFRTTDPPHGAPRVDVRVGADVAHYPPGSTFGPRTLTDYEFVWVLSGSARWDCADDAGHAGHGGYELTPGQLLLARPGMRDQFHWAEDQPSVHGYVHFAVRTTPGPGEGPGGWNDPKNPEDQNAWPLCRPMATGSPLSALCHYLLWLGATRTPAAAARTDDVVGWLLDLFVRGPVPGSDPEEVLPVHVDRLITYVRTRWQDGRTTALSVAELASGARISSSQLSRLFRERYGVGPVSALEHVRLARAATLLQRSNLTVAAIADASGFASPYHFSRRFRLLYGDAPRTYRNERSTEDPLQPLAPGRLLPLAYALLF